jgi:hypothetical protein
VPSQGWERERRSRAPGNGYVHIAHRGTGQPPAGIPAQNGPKCAACRGLAGGRSSGAAGLLGMIPPACRTFLPRVPRKVARATYKGVGV